MAGFDFELVVIGGGPAGEKGAAQAAYFGIKTALVEKETELGGACINTGTLASKTLRETSLFLSGAKARQLGYGIETSVKKDITLADFMYRKKYVQQREWERARLNLERHRITRVVGSASFLDAHTVEITKPSGAKEKVTGNIFLVATGSTPARPKTVPFNSENVFDSDTVLEMRALPKSMVVIGGGVIGSEYAGLFAALGIDVSLVHQGERVLAFLDFEIIDAFMRSMEQNGIQLLMKEELESCVVEGKWVNVKLKSGREISSEALLYAAGRSGNTAGLGLEKLGIAIGKYGHIENVKAPTYQTSVPNIYAAGDVIGAPALASTSMEQARMAMCAAFNLHYRKKKDLPLLPMGIYTIPEISAAGLTEEQCKKASIPYVTGRNKFGQHARGQIIGDTEGMIKLIFSAPGAQTKDDDGEPDYPEGGKLLGVSVIGEMASELVHTGMACLHFGGGIDYFIESVFNYPTLSDVYKYAAFDALGQLNKLRGDAPASPAAPGSNG
ncbi:MAG TPA: Si-specific NAD(P)(+) transhydrogenase [Tepidisphaeraceae bacterium]|jgi:NAD(P) transhydrogenase|nr:Si-specific NAD(P)(+) transhydrogenase [Tepidisphaeraceae bacterium]